MKQASTNQDGYRTIYSYGVSLQRENPHLYYIIAIGLLVKNQISYAGKQLTITTLRTTGAMRKNSLGLICFWSNSIIFD